MDMRQQAHDAIDKSARVMAMSFEDLVEDLKSDGRLIRRSHPFDIDSIVTPRPQFGYDGVGKPHVVMDTRKLERNRIGWSTAAYGKMADMLVARKNDAGQTLSFWVEGYAYEGWTWDKHGKAFNEARDAVIAKVAEMKADIDAKLAAEAIPVVSLDAPPAAPPVAEPTKADEPLPTVIGDKPTVETDVYVGEQPGPSPSPGPADTDKPGETVAPVVDPAGPAKPLEAPTLAPDDHENPFKGDAA